MQLLTGNDLLKMFEYGTAYVNQERKHLNDINVFPVPDGDTGNNLLHTLTTIVRDSKRTSSFFEQLDNIGEQALIGARGNSGVIFAQFVNGLRKSAPNKDAVEISEFADMVREGYNHTVSSLSNPVEGTIITLMDGFASSLKGLLKDGVTSLQELFNKAYKSSVDLLNETPKMLDVLKQDNVVDSGALGFTLFVKGISSYYNNDVIDLVNYENVEIEDEHHFEGEVTYRYCTEGLIRLKNSDTTKLKENLPAFGDSIVVAEGKSLLRVHVHTNEPSKVFEELKMYGHIESQKVDDMMLEMKLKNSNQKRVLVTDSIADIDKSLIENNNVVMIPINLDIDGVSYLDKVTVNNDYIFNHLNEFSEYPKTATPTIKYISNLFSKLFLLFEEIIVVSVSSSLGGTHNVIKGEAEKLKEKGKKIYVVDSLNNSVSEGLLVKRTIDLMNKNISTNEILNILDKERKQTEILVCLDTFKYAVKSGRVPKVVGKIGGLIGLRPIMSLENGKGTAYGFGLSQKAITKKIIKQVKKDIKEKGIKEYAIVHCENEVLAKEYADLFTTIIGKEPEYVCGISSAIAIFSGKGTVAIGYIKEG